MTSARFAALCCCCLVAALVVAPSAAAAPAGPAIVKCGKLDKPAKRTCLKQNAANRAAFNQIKDSKFVGVRGDGEAVESVYCANGKYESRTSGSSGTGVSTGSRWAVENAVVRQGGKWIDAFLTAPDGYEVALQRRGAQWLYGVASLGRVLYPGNVAKTPAAQICATL